MTSRSSSTPPEQLVAELRRLRDGGWAFEKAWRIAWRKVRWPNDTHRAREWRTALESTRPEFEAAYVGKPTAVAATVSKLALVESEGLVSVARTGSTDRISRKAPARTQGRAAFVA